MKTFFFTFKPECATFQVFTWIECDHAEGAKAQMTAEYQNQWNMMYLSFADIGTHIFYLKYIPFGSHEGLA